MKASLPESAAWFMQPQPQPQARLRLFCFPYAGGAAQIFRQWPLYLQDKASAIEVCAVQLPGRSNRLQEPCFTRLTTLATHLAVVIRPYLDRPFAFFGHSLGAAVSFELARALRREGAEMPSTLVVSSCPAPQTPKTAPRTYDLPAPELLDRLRRLNGTPRELLAHEELMEMMLPMLRADFEMVETYRYSPEPPLPLPLTVCGGADDPEVSREDLDAWRAQTTQSFALHLFPGDHFFINQESSALVQLIAQVCTGGRLHCPSGGR